MASQASSAVWAVVTDRSRGSILVRRFSRSSFGRRGDHERVGGGPQHPGRWAGQPAVGPLQPVGVDGAARHLPDGALGERYRATIPDRRDAPGRTGPTGTFP